MKKKYFLLSIFVLALATNIIFFTFVSAAQVFGDLNNDGKVNSTDSSLLKRHLLGTSTLSNPLLADVNGDGAVNSTDYSLYKRYLLNVITVFPGQTITVTPTPTIAPTITPTPVPIKIPNSGSEMDTSSIKTKYINLAYGSVSKTQTLDIYLPNEGSGPFPVIIAIHGGAFLSGSSKGTDIAPMLEGGINHGYAVVSLNYRLSSEAKFPAGVNDVKAAVRFVRANAAQYKLNTDKIAAWGFSSGGFLVSMLGTTGNVSTLNGDTKDNLNYSSDVKAVVDWSGHIDFLTMDDQFRASGIQSAFGNTNDASSPASQLIGQLITKDTALTEKANPETYISTMTAATAPAFLIQHGSSDNVVPCQQSINFAAKLKQAIGESKVTLDIINGAGHGGPEFSTASNISKIFSFLNSVFK